MRHKRPEGSIRLRYKGIYQIRYNRGIDTLTGKRERLEVTHKGTYDTARKELRRLLKSLDDQQHVEPSKLKVSEFMKQWLDTIETQVSPKTHERYSDIVHHFIIPTMGACPLHKLEPAAIQRTYNKWQNSGRRDNKSGGLAPRTRLHIHRVLRLALKHATRMRIIVQNPSDGVVPPRAKQASFLTLTIEQSALLLEKTRNTKLYWPILLALATGMRRGEALAMRWKNVDFARKTLRIMESIEQTKQGVRFKAPKTDRTRAVILPDYAVDELRRWKEIQKDELEKMNIRQTGDTVVCTTNDGKPFWPTSVTHEFIKAIRRIPDFPQVRFHDLRHSHATQLLASGIHPKIAQERLGHSTITTTLDLYSHATETMQDDAATKLDSAFRTAVKAIAKSGPKLG